MTAQIAQLTPTNELKIGIDVGSIKHSVAISDEFGNIIKEFEITHTNKGNRGRVIVIAFNYKIK